MRWLNLTFAVLLAGCSASAPSPLAWVVERLPWPSEAGQPAQDFAFQTFRGEQLALADFAGQSVVLNFWASWCVPCRAEMPHFERAYREYRERGVVFVGLAVEDDPQAARQFAQLLGITYPVGLDPRNQTALRYQVAGLPTTIFITRGGTVAKRWTGPIGERDLEDLLGKIAGG